MIDGSLRAVVEGVEEQGSFESCCCGVIWANNSLAQAQNELWQ